MAMDVEYEEYAATTSSKHHGWKVMVSQQHVERRELEDLEAKIAAVYAKIDAGDSVADLTAPAAVKRIKDMDRLGIGHDVGMYLTYPERRGYDVDYADTNDDGDVDPSEGTARGGERRLGDGAMARRADPNLRGEDLLRRMPLVKVGGAASGKGSGHGGALPEPEEGSVHVGSNAVVVHRAGAGRDSGDENKRALTRTGQVGPAVVRPKREVLYDVSHGVDMKRNGRGEGRGGGGQGRECAADRVQGPQPRGLSTRLGFFFGFFWFSVPTSSGAEKQDLILAPLLVHDDEREYAPTAEFSHPISATSWLDTSPARESAFGSPEQV